MAEIWRCGFPYTLRMIFFHHLSISRTPMRCFRVDINPPAYEDALALSSFYPSTNLSQVSSGEKFWKTPEWQSRSSEVFPFIWKKGVSEFLMDGKPRRTRGAIFPRRVMRERSDMILCVLVNDANDSDVNCVLISYELHKWKRITWKRSEDNNSV